MKISGNRDYELDKPIAEGTICNVYQVDKYIVKVAKDKQQERLGLEVQTLSIFKNVDSKLKELVPELEECFGFTDTSLCDTCHKRFACFTTNLKMPNCTEQKWVNVFKYTPDLVSVEDVITTYPNGIDPKDMAWMYKRILAALWLAHENDIVHRAVTPEHILLNLKTHGIQLIDWTHNDYKDYFTRHEAYYDLFADNAKAFDIAQATLCAIKLIGGDLKTKLPPANLEKELKLIFKAALMGVDDAKLVHQEFDNAIKKLWGPSVFRDFKIK